jgi:hypothetical protein
MHFTVIQTSITYSVSPTEKQFCCAWAINAFIYLPMVSANLFIHFGADPQKAKPVFLLIFYQHWVFLVFPTIINRPVLLKSFGIYKRLRGPSYRQIKTGVFGKAWLSAVFSGIALSCQLFWSQPNPKCPQSPVWY